MPGGAGGQARDEDGDKSQSTLLVEIAERADIFEDNRGDAFAAFEVDGHRETWSVRSASFKRWLVREFYMEQRKAPNGTALADAILVVEGRAQFEGETRPVWARAAEGADGAVYIDLGTPNWEAVRVTPSGWEVIAEPPVHFRRGPAMGALPDRWPAVPSRSSAPCSTCQRTTSSSSSAG